MASHKLSINKRATRVPEPYIPPETQLPHPPKPRITVSQKALSIAASVAIIIVAVVSVVAITSVTPKNVDALIVQPSNDPGVSHENIVLVGSDTRVGATSADNVGTVADVGGDRADTIMLASIPTTHDRATLVSLPRDTLVTPAKECGMDGALHKINELYSVGSGRKCFIATLENVFQARVTRYVSVSMPQMKHIVDKVGGVTLCFSEPMTDGVLGTISPQAGPYHMNGRQSLKFVRARHINGDGRSDLARVENQRLFLTALFHRISTLSPGKKADVASHILANTETDGLALKDVQGFMSLASTLSHTKIKRLTFPTVPSSSLPGALEIDESRVGEVLASLSATLKDESSAQLSPNMTREYTYHPSDITFVLRSNPALDWKVKKLGEKLESHGFTVSIDLDESVPVSSATRGFFSPDRYRELATALPALPGVEWTYMDESDDNFDTFALVVQIGDKGSLSVSHPVPYKTSVMIPKGRIPLSMKDVVVSSSHVTVKDEAPVRVTLCS